MRRFFSFFLRFFSLLTMSSRSTSASCIATCITSIFFGGNSPLSKNFNRSVTCCLRCSPKMLVGTSEQRNEKNHRLLQSGTNRRNNRFARRSHTCSPGNERCGLCSAYWPCRCATSDRSGRSSACCSWFSELCQGRSKSTRAARRFQAYRKSAFSAPRI